MRLNRKQTISSFAIITVVSVIVFILWRNILNSQLLQATRFDAGASVVSDLIHRGADPNAGDPKVYYTPLFQALIHPEDPDTIRLLLDAGASVRPQGPIQMSPAASLAANPEFNPPNAAVYRTIFTELRSHGVSLEERDAEGYSPLMRAIWSCNAEATQALLELGASPRGMNNYGETTQDLADRYRAVETIEVGTKIHTLLRSYTLARTRG